MTRFRAALLALACLFPCLLVVALAATPPRTVPGQTAGVQAGGVIRAIRVVGNKRIETGTIRSYMLVRPGDPFDPSLLDQSLKTLYATGLFQDVSLTRSGDDLVVHVSEYPLVNTVAFEGNHAIEDADLDKVVQLRPRAVFTRAAAETDRKRILDAYAQKGHYDATVDPEIIRLPENRVNVVFEINDGPSTLISRITFTGNHAYGEGRLAEVINSREERWWAFLSTSDQYSPQRLELDKELLRQFYFKHGYAAFSIVSATAELAPDRKAFFLTFVVHEGPRYRINKVTIHSALKGITPAELAGELQFAQGDWFDADAIRRSSDRMEEYVRSHGFAFVQVTPRYVRDEKARTMAISFDVSRGPRVFIERIDIVGNTRTQDAVIRRQFHLAEGDALQRRVDPAHRATPEGPRLFPERRHQRHPRLGARQGDRDGAGEREGDRLAKPGRRLLDRRGAADAGRHRREEHHRQRHRRRDQRHPGAEAELDRPGGSPTRISRTATCCWAGTCSC